MRKISIIVHTQPCFNPLLQ